LLMRRLKPMRASIDVNLTGAMHCAREAVRRMSTKRGGTGGAIVFLSSRATAYGSPGDYVWYAASKGGVDALTIGLAREVGPEGIRVNAVSPGPIDTDMLDEGRRASAASLVPLGRLGEPAEAAAAVLYLASDAASFVTGANLSVSGGALVRPVRRAAALAIVGRRHAMMVAKRAREKRRADEAAAMRDLRHRMPSPARIAQPPRRFLEPPPRDIGARAFATSDEQLSHVALSSWRARRRWRSA
jgi:short-subunit dehydrogenase